MNKTLEKILEDELFENQVFEGEGNLQIKNTSEETKLPIFPIGSSIQNGEPSSETPIEIKNCRDIEILNTHKNLLKPTWAQDLLDRLTANNIDYDKAVNKIVEINGHRYFQYQSWLAIGSDLIYFAKNCFKVNTQYTFKMKMMKNNDSISSNIKIYYTDGSHSGESMSQYANMTPIEYKMTSQVNKTIDYIGITAHSAYTYIDLDSCILYEGTDDLPYEGYGQAYKFPSKEGQVFHKGDYLADDGTHHVRKTVELDEIKNITVHTNSSGINTYYFRDVNDYLYDKNIFAISSHFKYFGTVNGGQLMFKKEEEGFSFYCEESSADRILYINCKKNLEEFKAWLAEQKANGTPVKIEYELAEEIIEPYSSEQQEAYTKLMQAVAYENETNIICTDEIPCNFKVNAKISKIKKIMEGE